MADEATVMKYYRLNHSLPTTRFYRRVVRTIFVMVIIVMVVAILYYSRFHGSSKQDDFISFSVWPQFQHKPLKSSEWFRKNCFKNDFIASLGSLEHNLKQWKTSDDRYCQDTYNIFNMIYNVAFRTGTIIIPQSFKSKVAGWLQNDPELVKEVYHQKTVHILNQFGKEHIMFNPLRSKRPQKHPEMDPMEYIKKNVKETMINCDFCNYKTSTSEDVFGRIITNHTVSAANTFKVDRWHSLIIPNRHNPIELTEEEIVDMYQNAILWVEKVHSLESEFKYPWILWDTMPHAGASQTHPHLHAGVYPNMYVGITEITRRGAQLYVSKYNRDYFTDLTSIHHVLGLSVTLGEAIAIAQLTSKKDTEITIISPMANTDLFRLVHYTIQAFMDMGYYDLSSLMVLPIMNSAPSDGSLPAMIRITSRGDVAAIQGDVTSFELYQFTNINVDPYVAIKALRNSISSRLKDSLYSHAS